MKIKCLALDMDGTILEDGHLLEENKKALQEALDQGVHVVVASGRSFLTLPEEVIGIPGIEYAITSNGASVYYIPTGERIYSSLISASSAEAVLKVTEGEPLIYEAFVDGAAYSDARYVKDPITYGMTPTNVEGAHLIKMPADAYLDFVNKTRTPVDDMPGFIRAHEGELESIALIINDGLVKKEVWKRLKEEVPDIYITSSVFHLVEISNKDTGKGTGLKQIAEILHLKREEIAAFGNEDNDCDMLTYAGVGVAVADASEACLKSADMIVPACHECGAAKGIRELLLQK